MKKTLLRDIIARYIVGIIAIEYEVPCDLTLFFQPTGEPACFVAEFPPLFYEPAQSLPAISWVSPALARRSASS